MGTAWSLFLDGEIDADSPTHLEEYLKRNEVPPWSYVVLNSPGGNLYAGMELGRIIRKNHLRTDIGQKVSKLGRFEVQKGVCFSACTLAYVGGEFRYIKDGSKFGVHRFFFSKSSDNSVDISQIASAEIVAYLQSMDIATELFSESTRAAADEINVLSVEKLQELNIVTNGFQRPKWSLETKIGQIYLKGERETVYGINKFIVMCRDKKQIVLYVVVDPQGRKDEIQLMGSHKLVVDGNYTKLEPFNKQVTNGWFNAFYNLNSRQVQAMRNAKNVGVIMQSRPDAPFFLGFDYMPLNEGKEMLGAFLNNCTN